MATDCKRGVKKVNDSVLLNKSIDFSIQIVSYYKWLNENKKEFVMSRQLLKSGTSIGANIHEAQYASSKLDFISKMQIALKEASETEYWFIVLTKTGYLDQNYTYLAENCLSLKRMLIATINTSKKNI